MVNLQWLDNETFSEVIERTPLISIDLLVENERGEYLLGLRKNRPAQGYWFVPGGRILKNESLDKAFKRLTKVELGIEFERNQSECKGVYEHFYQDSVFGEQISSHYIALAQKIKINSIAIRIDEQQHSEHKWLKPEEIGQVKMHKHSMDYFRNL